MIKNNVIIDGHYTLYKAVFILKSIKKRDICKELEEMLIGDFNKISKSFPFDNIYFVSDSAESSWRKIIYPEYKAGRIKDNTIDWDNVFKIYTDFKNKIRNRRNVRFLQSNGLEGDDFIAYIVKDSNKENFSNIIVASDIDINQLVCFDLTNKWINVQWNYKYNDERLYLPENYQLFIDHVIKNTSDDLFNMSNDTEFVEYIEKMANRTNVKQINNEESLFCKIVSGDSGDNIVSIIKMTNNVYDPDGRGIGIAGAKSVYLLYKEAFPQIIDFHSDLFVNQLVDIIMYYKKLKDQSMKTIITNNIIFNRKMVVLDSQYMPENIFEIMKAEYISEKEKVIKFEPIDLEHELEKSDFFKSKEDIKPEFNCEKTSVFEKDTFFDIDDDIDDCFELVEPEEVKKEDVDDIFEITDDKSSEYRDAEGYDKLKEDDFWN